MLFCIEYLQVVGVEKVVRTEDWHDRLAAHPSVMSWFAAFDFVFSKLDDNAKDMCVAKNIDLCSDDWTRLGRMFGLMKEELLNEAQSQRVRNKLRLISCNHLLCTGIPFDVSIDLVVQRLGSIDFETSNNAARFLSRCKIEELKSLSEKKLQSIGEALGNAVANNAFVAISYIQDVGAGRLLIPERVVSSCCECLISRMVEICGRDRVLNALIDLLSVLPEVQRDAVIVKFIDRSDGSEFVQSWLSLPSGKEFLAALTRLGTGGGIGTATVNFD